VIFDLLYVNDKSVMDLNLQQRNVLLKRCVKTKEKVIEIVEQREGRQTSDVVNALDEAILNRFV
jgi:ATP-dependent DNA ligase